MATRIKANPGVPQLTPEMLAAFTAFVAQQTTGNAAPTAKVGGSSLRSPVKADKKANPPVPYYGGEVRIKAHLGTVDGIHVYAVDLPDSDEPMVAFYGQLLGNGVHDRPATFLGFRALSVRWLRRYAQAAALLK